MQGLKQLVVQHQNRGPKRTGRRKKRTGRQVVAPQVQEPIMRAAKSGRRRTRNTQSDGSMTVTRDELLKVVSVDTGKTVASGSVKLHPDSFSWLKGVAKSFERAVWKNARVYWKPAVGTHVNGLLVAGVDWASKMDGADRSKIQALTPIMDFPVWQGNATNPMVLPPSRLMSRKEYVLASSAAEDSAPGSLVYNCTTGQAGFMGELWVRYTVQLFGTTV